MSNNIVKYQLKTENYFFSKNYGINFYYVL